MLIKQSLIYTKPIEFLDSNFPSFTLYELFLLFNFLPYFYSIIAYYIPQILQNLISSQSFFYQNIFMFDRSEGEQKFDHFMYERTAAQFGETHDESFVYEVEAEKQYVERLKNQREKIETLYSKYDVLLKDLKTKEGQIREKDKTISNLESKCKTLAVATQESTVFKQQNKEIKTENHSLQRAISELEQSYSFLHGQFKSKQAVTSQKYEEMEHLNDELMSKLRSFNKKYLERQEEFAEKFRDVTSKLEECKVQGKKEREEHLQEEEILKAALLQKDEEIRLLKTENECLKERINEFEAYVNELVYQQEQKLEHVQKQRKIQLRALKGEIQALRENNLILEKKWQKLREEFQIKELSLSEMTMVIQQHEKQSNEAMVLLKQQFAQEKSLLKEQLIHCENHIAKLERKIADCVRKEQCLYGKIKKYEVCLDAKRSLREIEKQELQRINLLLNLP